MSLPDAVVEEGGTGFPRVSGDEPPSRLTRSLPDAFSPRERG